MKKNRSLKLGGLNEAQTTRLLQNQGIDSFIPKEAQVESEKGFTGDIALRVQEFLSSVFPFDGDVLVFDPTQRTFVTAQNLTTTWVHGYDRDEDEKIESSRESTVQLEPYGSLCVLYDPTALSTARLSIDHVHEVLSEILANPKDHFAGYRHRGLSIPRITEDEGRKQTLVTNLRRLFSHFSTAPYQVALGSEKTFSEEGDMMWIKGDREILFRQTLASSPQDLRVLYGPASSLLLHYEGIEKCHRKAEELLNV